MKSRPVGILYEHTEWLKPLFSELQKRKIPFVRIHAGEHTYNPAEQDVPYSLLVNRISSTANLRGNAQGIFQSNLYLAHVQRLGIPVINGPDAQEIEASKAKQLEVLATLALPFPKTRIVNHISQILPAARSLRFPIIVKVNLSNSADNIWKFASVETLNRAVDTGKLHMGLDHSAIVQEFIPTQDNHIVRVETLNGKFLYAVRISGQNENNARKCALVGYEGSPETEKLKVERYSPSHQVIRDVERIIRASKLDAGAVEYATDVRTGVIYYCNIVAFSRVVDGAKELFGFDPHGAFVDMIEQKLWPAYESEPVLAV